LLELKKDNFREHVGVDGIVLIECWTPSCAACKQFDPVFAAAADRYPDHTFARMNVDTDDALGEFFEVSHTPTLMLYRGGLLLLKKPGVFSAEALNEIVRQAESLDMERVQADLTGGTEDGGDASSS
jgi:thioredoxin 1